MNRRNDGRGRSRGLDLEVYDLVLKPVSPYPSALAYWFRRRNQRGPPFSKSLHARFQVPPRLELRIYYGLDRDIGQCMSHESTQMLWEIAKGVVTALRFD